MLLLLITLASHLGNQGMYLKCPKKLLVFTLTVLELEANESLVLPGIALQMLYLKNNTVLRCVKSREGELLPIFKSVIEFFHVALL